PVPPQPQPAQEIPRLTAFFQTKYAAAYRCPPISPSPALLRALAAHTWPGNIRELENMVQRCVVLQDEALVLADLARLRGGPELAPPASVAPVVAPPAAEAGAADACVSLHAVSRRAAVDAERAAIADALGRFRWNRRQASQYLDVSYKTLLTKIKECGLAPTEPR
ncbi:MAG: sigma-54-dependent Fis family transcriptional regulator, partial [Acidobacteria bacterium]|nr:sigma-54-dependent Fis family transcriptional regulator [Acidobacteriota bacterium]